MNAKSKTTDALPAGRPKYTPQQQLAIETRRSSVALAAGAGCGKTFVLTERFLSELDPAEGGRDLGSLVAITFTERAAREMRSRIREACRKRLRQATEGEVEFWLKIVRNLDSARISTIHAFCGGILRANAAAAGVDPQFSVLERATADPLRRMAVSETIQDLLSERQPEAMDLVRELGLEKLMRILDRLIPMRYQFRSRDWSALGPEGLEELWRTTYRTVHLPKVMDEIFGSEELGELKALVELFEPGEGVMLERWENIRRLLGSPPKGEDLSAWLVDLRSNAMVKGATGKKVWPSAEVKEQVTSGLERIRKWADKMRGELQFADEDLGFPASLGFAAYCVSLSAIERYEELKRASGGLDFDDLLTLTRDLLVSSEDVRKRAAAGIDFLMVDEFQDTDPTQAEIVRALVGEGLRDGKLFLVGDAQQSIYRFRRADPRVFAALQQEIPAEGRLPLTRNFRSQPAILNFVNAVFAEAGEGYEPLVPFDDRQATPEPAIEFLFSTDEGEGEEAENAAKRRSREAGRIAQRIRGMLADPTPRIRVSGPKGEAAPLRRMQAGDIVILFRALSDVQLYEAALRDAGLEYYLVGGKAFYAQQEVFDISNLCRFLNDPTDHVSLLGVLRSPFCNLSDDAVFAVWRTEQDLWKGLQGEPPVELPENQQEDVRRAGRVLKTLLDRRDRMRIAPLLRLALDLTGYDAALLTEFLGRRKLANLQKLLEMARGFDQVGVFGLEEFVEQLNTAVLEETDEELAATHPEASNVIRLMTIHQSKGLEFPVVFVADMDRAGPPRTPEGVFDADLGPLIAPPARHGHKPVHPGLKMYLAREKREDLSETLRLLYVALTRAADQLVLCGGLKGFERLQSPWLKRISERFDLRSGRPQVSLSSGELTIPAPYRDKVPLVLAHAELPVPAMEKSSLPRGLPLGEFLPAVTGTRAEAPPVPLIPETLRRGQRVQMSLSELESGATAAIDRDEAISVGMEVEPVSSEELGTLVHQVLERLDYRRPESSEEVLERLWSSSRTSLNAEQRSTARRLIDPFLRSEGVATIARAKRSYREIDFQLQAGIVHPDCQGKIISGTIDLFLETEEGRWIIADFKTGRRLAHRREELLAEYELQMGVYSLAVRQILGRLPDEVWLIHLRLEDPIIKYEVNESLLSRVGERVRGRISELTSGSQSL